MGLLISLIAGGLIGWLAGKVMGVSEGVIANIVIGIIGSALGHWLFGRLLGIASASAAGPFSLPGLAFGIAGAAILIFLLKKIGLLR